MGHYAKGASPMVETNAAFDPFDPFGDPAPRSAKELKDAGNEAFRSGEWEEAASTYTQCLEVDPSNHRVFSNRAAAYVKLGRYEEALDDAEMSIQLKPGYHKGYGWKGATHHAMKRYDDAIAAYKEGLEMCGDEEQLKLGLAASKRARLSSNKAHKAARKTDRSRRATRSETGKAKKATNVSVFVTQTREEVQSKIQALQAQLELLDELSQMSNEEKSDYLFNLIDRDGDGTLDATELAAALRKRNSELSFGDSMGKAIKMVDAFDTDGDSRLDTEEFFTFLNAMTTELGVDFHEFVEFLVHKLIFEEDDEDSL